MIRIRYEVKPSDLQIGQVFLLSFVRGWGNYVNE